MVKDVLCKGLEDSDIQQDLLGNTKQDMTLDEVITFVAAKEEGKRSQCDLHSDNTHSIKVTPKTQSLKGQCYNCGEERHSKRSACPALNTTCTWCLRPNHRESVCRSKKREEEASSKG